MDGGEKIGGTHCFQIIKNVRRIKIITTYETLPYLKNLVMGQVVDRLGDRINFFWLDSVFSPEIARD